MGVLGGTTVSCHTRPHVHNPDMLDRVVDEIVRTFSCSRENESVHWETVK